MFSHGRIRDIDNNNFLVIACVVGFISIIVFNLGFVYWSKRTNKNKKAYLETWLKENHNMRVVSGSIFAGSKGETFHAINDTTGQKISGYITSKKVGKTTELVFMETYHSTPKELISSGS